MEPRSIQPSAALAAPPVLSAEAALAAAMLEVSDTGSDSARRRASELSTQRTVSLVEARFALKKQQEAAEDGGIFGKWSSELQVAALVASAAATVATCGAGAPLAVAVLSVVATTASATSYAMKQTGADAEMCKLNIGGKEITLNFSDGVALAGLAAGVGGAVASAGSAAAEAGKQGASATAQASRTAEASLQTATDAAGQTGAKVANSAAEVGARASAEASAIQKLCSTAADILNVTASAAKAGQAYFTVREGLANAEALEHGADAQAANDEVEVINFQTEEAVDRFRDAAQLRSKILEAVDALMNTQAETHRFIIGSRV